MPTTPNTRKRKSKHLSICTSPHEYQIEHGSTGLDRVHFVHRSLPEVDASEVATSLDFMGHTIAAPVFISCMTGGSVEGFRTNKNLARAAEVLGVPVGMGSIRVALEHEEVVDHFRLKSLAPSVPVLANIGGVQLRDLPHGRLIELVKRLEADAIVIHLNPGQELFQKGGDRDFRGVRSAIREFRDVCPFPVVVMETGFGIDPDLISDLVSIGVDYVDVAGAGGTNWISVESYIEDETHLSAAEFQDWGMPTGLILAAARRLFGNRYEDVLIASGGLRSGMDFAKAVGLGAVVAGAALPFARAEASDGVDGVVRELEHLIATIKRVMTMVGVVSVSELRRAPMWYEAPFSDNVDSFANAARTQTDAHDPKAVIAEW